MYLWKTLTWKGSELSQHFDDDKISGDTARPGPQVLGVCGHQISELFQRNSWAADDPCLIEIRLGPDMRLPWTEKCTCRSKWQAKCQRQVNHFLKWLLRQEEKPMCFWRAGGCREHDYITKTIKVKLIIQPKACSWILGLVHCSWRFVWNTKVTSDAQRSFQPNKKFEQVSEVLIDLCNISDHPYYDNLSQNRPLLL